jgi:hypothetical protein
MIAKRKSTITIDGELVNEFERAGNVSAQLNEAGWALVERRHRAERLRALLDRFEREDGPVPDDPEEDARIERLLGGVG